MGDGNSSGGGDCATSEAAFEGSRKVMPRQRRVKKGRGAKVRKSSEITVVKSCRTIKTSAPVSHKGSDWMIREEARTV